MNNKKPLSHEAWRKIIFLRDGHKCVHCGSTERLEADHIEPVSKSTMLMREVSNGRTLCHECHKKTDTYGGKLLKGRRQERMPYGSL